VRAAVTSASPPVLANGATSEAIAQILTELTISSRIPIASWASVMGAVILATTVAGSSGFGGDLRGVGSDRHIRRQLAGVLPPLNQCCVAAYQGLALKLSIANLTH
jgi:hypothetical protein